MTQYVPATCVRSTIALSPEGPDLGRMAKREVEKIKFRWERRGWRTNCRSLCGDSQGFVICDRLWCLSCLIDTILCHLQVERRTGRYSN
jgi:hypothetical protein